MTGRGKNPADYLLDTSALLALWNNEAGADAVEKVLREGSAGKVTVYLSFMSLMEIRYRLLKSRGKEAADEIYQAVRMLPCRRVDVDEELILLASDIKGGNSLSVADSFILATAIQQNCTLLHKDPEFESLRDKVSLLTLPYK